MKSVASEHFWRLFHALPADVRREARKAFKLFNRDANAAELHFKLVIKRQNVWSIRFGDQYRALGERQGDRIFWIWIGKHTEYEQIIHGTRR
jgi:hypothetical protein